MKYTSAQANKLLKKLNDEYDLLLAEEAESSTFLAAMGEDPESVRPEYDYTRRAKESIGTLGGGNHFIEIDTDGDSLYLVIHTGSRNLGLRVAEYYQKTAYNACGGRAQSEIPYELAFLEGDSMQSYLHDMELMQRFAALNRTVIKEVIVDGLKLHEEESFETIHNYIDTDNMILRKGAVSAKKGEQLLIPMNMRDGSLLCTGLGNSDWNCSAPHGAGRLMNRRDAEQSFTLSQFKKSMEGIFTTSISKDTIDESPFVYKPMEEILKNISETVTVNKILKPIYNFKVLLQIMCKVQSTV